MKRTLPLLILLGAGLPVGIWLWRRGEPARRFGRIDEVLRAYQDKPHDAWSENDANALWKEVAWFHERDREGFQRRLVTALASDDTDERFRAALLAAHIDSYAEPSRSLGVDLHPWRLPLPGSGVLLREDFDVPNLARRYPEIFARLADDSRADAHACLIRLGGNAAASTPLLRDAFLRVLTKSGGRDAGWILQCLSEGPEDPVVTGVLVTFVDTRDIGLRFAAATFLAFLGDPAGTRLFMDLVSDPGNDLSRRERLLGFGRLSGRFRSLEGLHDDTQAAIFQGWDAVEEILPYWRSWLEIREHEGFRADAQLARDEAWIETSGR